MKNQIKCFILLLVAVLSADYLTAQETNLAVNIRSSLSLDGKQLVIEYDLPFADTTQLFDISLTVRINDKIIQPNDRNLHGSFGTGVKPGNEKIVLWDFDNEIKGDMEKVVVDVVAVKTKVISAGFDFNLVSNKPPYEVRFINKSQNADLYSWKFGDSKSGKSNVSNLESPVHTYKSQGNYNVELTAGNTTNKTTNTVVRMIAVGKGTDRDLQKHKMLKTIFLGSAVATAGAGGFFLAKSVSLNKEWRTATQEEDPDKLKKQYKTFGIAGTAALAVTGGCIAGVLIQSKKIKAYGQEAGIYFSPLDRGGILSLKYSF
jgi:PKD repeat protein